MAGMQPWIRNKYGRVIHFQGGVGQAHVHSVSDDVMPSEIV